MFDLEKSTEEMTKEIEKFYKEAFFAKSAEVITNDKDFKIISVVKIITGDSRGTVYYAKVDKA